MLVVRMRRQGRNKVNTFSVVVAEQRFGVKGRYLEKLGNYDPKSKDVTIEKDRLSYWISQGAQPSESVARLLVKNDIMKEASKYIRSRTFKAKVAEVEKTEESPAVEASAEQTVQETPVVETPVEQAVQETPSAEVPVETPVESETVAE